MTRCRKQPGRSCTNASRTGSTRTRREIAELDELVGYHLEEATATAVSLDLDAEARGVRAAERLAAAGRRAFGRNDMPAAVNLLQRATALWPEDDVRRLGDLPALGRAMVELGDSRVRSVPSRGR